MQIDEQQPAPGPSRPGPEYGAPRPLWRWLAEHPPPGPFRPQLWRSPLRGPRLTAVLGAVLLVALPVVALTGLLSYAAYGPDARPADPGWLRLPAFAWPTRPAWLYRLTQGLHVALGLALVPVVLAKLWSVVPRLFAWPPARSVAEVLERLSLGLLVGGVLFEIVTGLLNIQYDYVFGFDFYTAHYYGAWVFMAALAAHIALKLPVMLHALRRPGPEDDPGSGDPHGLVAVSPAPPTVSRRGLLTLVGGGSLALTVVTVGQTLGDGVRWTALLAPRGRAGDGPNGFPVNRTAAAAGIPASAVGADWRLTVTGGPQPVLLDRAALLRLPQHTARLPIACVEGWSTTQTWTGVRLGDLAALAGVRSPDGVRVTSLERGGPFAGALLERGQVRDPDALLALRVNGADLSPDHGFPARIVVPALPGVRCTKWVGALEFRSAT